MPRGRLRWIQLGEPEARHEEVWQEPTSDGLQLIAMASNRIAWQE